MSGLVLKQITYPVFPVEGQDPATYVCIFPHTSLITFLTYIYPFPHQGTYILITEIFQLQSYLQYIKAFNVITNI